MKHLCFLLLGFVLGLASTGHGASALRDIPMAEVRAAFDRPVPAHPRLFMTDTQLAEIKTRLQSRAALQGFYRAMLKKADDLLPQEPVKREQTGRRLLGVSRRCLDRVFHLSAAYRFTRKSRYLERAQQEMLAAAAFSDWNPSHFLDVAEMTAALAIGYDWLYPELSQASRSTIRQAIMEKGIHPALKHKGWVRGQNNWNQVCNGGITLGILVLMEEHPDLAQRLVHRAVNGVQAVMAHYEPDGAYPEGPGYWVYGTSYNVVLLAALDSVLGTDFGLSKIPGFSRCAEYYLHVTGPTGLYFNYPDSGSRGGFQPTVFWFAQHYQEPSLAWYQHQLWQEAQDNRPSVLVQSRLAPLLLCWNPGRPAVPQALSWRGRGSNAVAMFRSSWTDPEAVYLAIKGGSASVSHGHMDAGSFVMDALGLRWVVDLGAESYHKIESRGMNLWGRRQDAERWTIFRYNNLSHSTLVVNGQHQRVEGTAPIIRFSDQSAHPHVVFDLSPVYRGQLTRALRGAYLNRKGQVVIQDEIKALDQPATVRWAMVTPAQVTFTGDKSALLKQQGKTLGVTLIADARTKLRTYSTRPKAEYDAPNPGTRLLGFEVSLAPHQALRMAVVLDAHQPEAPGPLDLQPVLQWSTPQ